MLQLSPDECRILGTLVEKAQTTPAQYPMSLNGLTAGCNQLSNRDPVTHLSEEQVLDALDSLRKKGLVRDLLLSGSRVTKYRHLAREVLGIETAQLILLAEMMLRGPQTSGELRSRASRMHPIESLEAVEGTLTTLIDRPEPMVRRLSASPGSRAPRYAQLLCPDLHPLDAPSAPAAATPASTPEQSARLAIIESDLARHRTAIQQLAAALGLGDPLA